MENESETDDVHARHPLPLERQSLAWFLSMGFIYFLHLCIVLIAISRL